jgi:hypothetical protein
MKSRHNKTDHEESKSKKRGVVKPAYTLLDELAGVRTLDLDVAMCRMLLYVASFGVIIGCRIKA